MNCPSRVDPEALPNGYNQNPGAFALHTNNDLNRRANLIAQRDHRILLEQPQRNSPDLDGHMSEKPAPAPRQKMGDEAENAAQSILERTASSERDHEVEIAKPEPPARGFRARMLRLGRIFRKFAKFIGPGFMVAVAYIDPGTPMSEYPPCCFADVSKATTLQM